jgi:hypothetical protein
MPFVEKKSSAQTERFPTTVATWNHCIETGIHPISLSAFLLTQNSYLHFLKFGDLLPLSQKLPLDVILSNPNRSYPKT